MNPIRLYNSRKSTCLIPEGSLPCLAAALLLAVLAGGCSVLPGSAPPTFIPEGQLPTVIELTAQALVDEGLVTPPPSATLSPAQLTAAAAPTQTPTETPEPSLTLTATLDLVLATPEPLTLPDPLPQPEIQIITPGRLSRLKSPFTLHLYLAPAQAEKNEEVSYQVALYGEDGRLISQEPFLPEDQDSDNFHQVMQIGFSIPGSAESARLEIRSLDSYGRTKALVTTELVLLAEGDEQVKAIQDLDQDLIIQQPIPSTLIQGNILILQGITRYAPDDQLVVELINRDGGQVGSGLVAVSQEVLGAGYRPFEGEIPYQVGSSSWIRVQVIARDGNFSGVQYITSVEVLVSP